MDNHIFRSAIGGFNRQDVMEYIEKAQKEAAENVQRLEEDGEELRRSEDALRQSLDTCNQERDELAQQLEDMTGRYEEAKTNWESSAETAEQLRGDVVRRDESIRELTAENQKLSSRLQELENELAAIRLEKEKIAQLELEAHKRCDEILAAAQNQADATVDAANTKAAEVVQAAQEQAGDTIQQANTLAEDTVQTAENRAQALTEETSARVEQMRRELAEHIAGAVDQYNSLQSAVETITSHVSSELRKLNVTVAQLPINFDHLKDSLQTLMERTKEN